MNALFEEFSASNAATWKERLSRDLKGITFEDLSITDRNNITIHPFYTSEDEAGNDIAVFEHKDWTICASVKVDDEKTANKKALNELQNGASGLCFTINGPVDWPVLLNEIQIQYIYIHFNIPTDIYLFLSGWEDYLASQNLKPCDIDCTVNFDPVQQYLLKGELKENETKDAILKTVLITNSTTIDASVYQNAGACSTYQLACCIAQTNEHLLLVDASGKIKDLKKIVVCITSGTDFFEEIAKLRALKILLLNLFCEYDIHPALHIHVVTSDTYRSAFDSYSNLLRDTLSGMAAVLGGCHSLLIHSFDQSINEPGEFNSRMSRNQQLIFKEESYLHQIADASAGSFYLEKLTEQLAEKAWTSFQQIEKDGGLIASFEKGIIKQSVETQAAQWIQEYKEGKRVLIGVNKYVNAKDIPVPSPVATEKGKGLKIISLTAALI